MTSEDAINLGGTVGPALLKAYGARLALAVLVLAVVVWLVQETPLTAAVPPVGGAGALP